MATTILTQIVSLINSGHSLAAAVESVVPGADVATWERHIARQAAPTPAKPKRKSSKRTSTGQPSKRFNYAAEVAARGYAMAELVERTNGRSILVNLPGGAVSVLEVA